MFGFMADDLIHWSLNYITIYAKYYIFIKKQFEKNDVEFYCLLPYLNTVIKRQLNIFKKYNNKSDFADRLLEIKNYLEPQKVPPCL